MDQFEQLIGSEIGNYTVVGVLGQGSMGVVLHGRAVDSDKEVAIKLLAPELVRDEVSRERMVREARALSKLNHPNIVSTYEFDSLANGRAYLVMEYVKGENLDDYLEREKTLPLRMTIVLALQLSNAMAFAHDEGIIHRDIKPQNIMMSGVRGKLTCKILDFGIAKMIEDRKKLTRTGEVVGSPIFMSPEQCTGKKLDQRTDVYSLGIILFKCLTGKYPHHGSTLRDTFLMKTTLPPPSVKKHNPQYDGPPQLENLISKCLEIKPEDRYRTMADIYLELRELARDYNLLDTMERSRAEASGDAPKRPDTETIKKFAQIKNLEPDRKPVNKVMVISIIVALAVFALLAASFAMPGILKVEPEPKAMQKPVSFSEVDESKIRVRKEPVDKAGSRSQSIEKVETRKPENFSSQSVPRKQTASPDTTRSSAKKAPAGVEPKERSTAGPRARGKLSTRDQEHDTWWDYRLKNEN